MARNVTPDTVFAITDHAVYRVSHEGSRPERPGRFRPGERPLCQPNRQVTGVAPAEPELRNL